MNNICVYVQVAAAKSGPLLSLPTELCLMVTGNESHMSDARHAAEAFAIAFQILDDLDDIKADRGSGDTPVALNAVFVLHAAGYGEKAVSRAQEIAIEHLQTAIGFAQRLPNRSGNLLEKIATNLYTQAIGFSCGESLDNSLVSTP